MAVKDPGAPFDAAADAVKSAGQESKDQADWLRNWYMNGMGQSLGYLGPASGYASGMSNMGPGTMEAWYKQFGSQFQDPTNQQRTYTQFSNFMNDPWANLTAQGDRESKQYISGPTAAGSFYSQYAPGLTNYSGPTYGRDQYYANQPSYNNAGAGESFYTQNQSKYGNDTNSQRQYELTADELQNVKSYAEQMAAKGYPVSQESLMASMKAQKFAAGPTVLQQNEGENKGYIRGANQAADYYASQLPALTGPGAYENFVTSDIAGVNPLYERTRDRGIATINQEMARRGGFNSGAAIDRIGNYTAELDAQDYQNRANRAQQAQQMQLARIGQGQQAALGTAGLDVQRGSALGQLDTANESAQLGRQGLALDASKAASAENQANAMGQLAYAQAGDQSRLARLMGLGTLANNADANNLSFLNAGEKAANDAESQMLARLAGGMGAANSVDQTRLSSDNQGLQRLLAAFGMAEGSDASNLARAKQLFEQGQGLDKSMMDRYALLNTISQGSDQQKLANLLGMGTMANNAQNSEQERMKQAFDALLASGMANSGVVGNFYNMGGDAYKDFYGAGIGADINSAGLRAQGEQERMQLALALAGLQQQREAQNRQAGWDAFNSGIGLAGAFGGGGRR